MKVLRLVLCLAVSACGSSAKHDSGGGAATGPKVLQPGVKAVSGQFFVGSATEPAAGYEIWLFDHTGAAYNRVVLDDTGSFSLPITTFVQDHTYSFHLVRDFDLVGDVDLAPNTPGVQPAFSYTGGYGFDLGQIVVPVDKRGVPTATGGITGTVGGGFDLDTTAAATFSTFPLPTWLTVLQAGSQLLIDDAETALYSFYGRTQNPDLYARDLQRESRFGFVATAASGTTITRAYVMEAGAWASAARLPAATDDTPEVAPLWSTTGTSLQKIDDTHYAASAFAAGLPADGTIVSVRVAPDTGPSVAIPLMIPRVIIAPPQLVSAAFDGTGIVSTINYSDTTVHNGLTQPFCQISDVVMNFSAPLDSSGQALAGATLPRIDVFFDYFTASSGRTVSLAVTGDQLPSPYNAVESDTAIPDVQRDWDPTLLRLRFTLGSTASGGSTQQLQIPKALLPSSTSAGSISKVRLRVVYGSDTEATAAGTLVWLNKGC